MKNTQRGFAIGIVIAIIAILALGGGAVYVARKAEKKVSVETVATTTAEASVNADVGPDMGSTTSLTSLLGLGKSMMCTFVDTASMSEGKVFIANGKVRGDFTSNVSGSGSVKSYMITDGSNIYVWSDSMKQGFKMKATAQAETSGNTGAPDMNKQLNYDCDAWNTDAAVFTPPASITFIDAASIGAGANVNVKIPN